MKIKNKQILCIGELLWDRLPSGAKPGGAPMNVALHLNAIGQNAILASRVGKDEPGRRLISFLEEAGMNTELIQIDEKLPTSEVLVHLDENNNATFDIVEPVAWDNLQLTQSLNEKAKESGILIYGSLASRNAVARETIMDLLDYDAVKLIDINFRKPYDTKEVVEQLLKKTDVVKLNEEELLLFTRWYGLNEHDDKSIIKWFADKYNLDTVCITKGSNGAVLYFDGNFYEHRGFKIDVVDTVGAGDAFLAGLVSSLINNDSPAESLAFACATGALVASKAGGTPRYNMEEINQILD